MLGSWAYVRTHRAELDRARAAIKSEIDRALRPKNSLVGPHEWWLHKNENTQVDIVRA